MPPYTVTAANTSKQEDSNANSNPSPNNRTPEASKSKMPINAPTPSSTSPYLNNPSIWAPVHVDCSAPEEERNRQLILAARTVCPQFFSGDMESVKVKVLTGGLSNALFIVSTNAPRDVVENQEDEREEEEKEGTTTLIPASVLIRVHFDDSDSTTNDISTPSDPSTSNTLATTTTNSFSSQDSALFVHRERELTSLCHLSQCGLAPALYGRFENGRVEEFYHNASPLTCEEMKMDTYWRSIARIMGRLHLQNVPLPAVDGVHGTNKGGEEEEEGPKAECWEKIDRWFGLVEKVMPKTKHQHNDTKTPTSTATQLEEVEAMKQEWTWLKHQLTTTTTTNNNNNNDASTCASTAAMSFARQVVFTHMDCQSLNLLRSPAWQDSHSHSATSKQQPNEEPLRLIDFEYSGYNPRAADMANTFCECCDMNNLQANYSTQYPTIQQQEAFLRAYIEIVDSDPSQQWLHPHHQEEEEGGVFMEVLRREVGKHALLSHMGWAVWAVVQSVVSPIEYDYVGYAKVRMEGYGFCKKMYFGEED